MTAGQPGQIHGLAGAFESAAREAEQATATGKRASLKTGEAYRVNGGEVHAVDVETGRTRKLLGSGGEDLEKIGKILRGIGDDLSTKAGAAKKKVSTLEGTLGTLRGEFTRYEADYRAKRAQATAIAATGLDTAYGVEKQAYYAKSRAEAERTGRDVRDNLVNVYDRMLGGRTAELSTLGYAVPTKIDQGPGDVESDPHAGTRDAQTVSKALDLKPGAQSLAEIDAAMGQIRAINEKVANGEALTSQERAYLNQFYEKLGTKDLAGLNEHVRNAVGTNMAPGMTMGDYESRVNSALQPFGDSIMNLSQGARYESLPTPVRELLDTRLGHVDPHTGLRHLNPRMLEPSNYPEGSNPTTYMLGGGVTGMKQLGAITDILGASQVKPGDGLATHLVDTALRAKQDLNSAHWMAEHGAHFRRGGEDFSNQLSTLVDDSGASDLLSIAARNNDASSSALLDGHDRAALLGLNWEDSTGATDVVQAGTERDPAAGGGTTRQTSAALAVVQEVAGDRDGYLGRMTEPMKGAVNDVGMTYIEAFAEPPVGGKSEVVHNRTDALGREIDSSFQLSADDRDHFLQFVSGTGDENATEFQTQAKVWGQATMADAFMNGTPEQVTRAMQTAGRLDGAIAQANFDYTADQTAEKDAAAAAAYRAAQIDARSNQGALNTLAVAGKEALGLVPGAGKAANIAISIGTEMVKGAVGVETLPPSAPTPQLPQNLEDMRRTESTWATQQQNIVLAQAMDTAGLFEKDDRPTILVHDDNHDGKVDDPRSDSQNMSTLGPQVATALDRWGTAHAEPGTRGDVDPNAYLSGRGEAYSGTFDGDGDGAPAKSQWHDDHLYYGSPPIDGPLISREPDPRKLDAPDWTPHR